MVKDFMTPSEASEWLEERGVTASARTVRRWLASGALGEFRMVPNGRIHVRRSELEQRVKEGSA